MATSAKAYIGDGVYVDIDPLGIILTTEDGIRVTNEIVLEPEVWGALRLWVKQQILLEQFRAMSERNG
jgi:hypothetical protein